MYIYIYICIYIRIHTNIHFMCNIQLLVLLSFERPFAHIHGLPSRQVFLDKFHKTRKGGWLGGSSPDFHTAKLYSWNSPKYADLVLSVELRWVGGWEGAWLPDFHTQRIKTYSDDFCWFSLSFCLSLGPPLPTPPLAPLFAVRRSNILFVLCTSF